MKIYTKTGDKGQTSLFGGKRVSKSSLRVEAYGTVDELNSAIGITIAEVQSSLQFGGQAKFKVQSYRSKFKSELESIQYDLLDIGSQLANPVSKRSRLPGGATFTQKRITEIEELIDELTKELPELKNFILPGGGVVGSMLHFARTICRRAERRIVELSSLEEVPTEILMYFNRLSDLFFTMARFVNLKTGEKETIWKTLKL